MKDIKMMKNDVIFLSILLLVGCLMTISSDIYAPSLVAISDEFEVSLNEAQWTLPIFLIGISLCQLIYGPLSEGVGRKPPLLVGLFIMLIGTILCWKASSIELLLAGRFVQGLGAGAGASLWRSMFRDKYHGDELAKFGAYLSVGIIIVMPMAPTLGGYLEEWFGWRSCFQFLLGYTFLAILAVLFFYQETNIHRHPERLNLTFFRKTFHRLLKSPVFMGYAACVFLTYGGSFSWYTIGPVLLIETAGLTPVEFGWICTVGGFIAMGIGGFLNGRLVTRYGSTTMLQCGWLIMFLSGVLMLITYWMYGVHWLSISICFITFVFGSTFLWTNAFAAAFTPFGDIAGYAAALYSFIQIGGGAVIGSFAAFLPDDNQFPLALIFILCPALSYLIYRKVIVPTQMVEKVKKS